MDTLKGAAQASTHAAAAFGVAGLVLTGVALVVAAPVVATGAGLALTAAAAAAGTVAAGISLGLAVTGHESWGSAGMNVAFGALGAFGEDC